MIVKTWSINNIFYLCIFIGEVTYKHKQLFKNNLHKNTLSVCPHNVYKLHSVSRHGKERVKGHNICQGELLYISYYVAHIDCEREY